MLGQLGERGLRPKRRGALDAEQLEQFGPFGSSDDRSAGDGTSESVESTSSRSAVTLIHPAAPASRHAARTARRRSEVSITTLVPSDTAGRIRLIPLPTPLRGLSPSRTHCGRNSVMCARRRPPRSRCWSRPSTSAPTAPGPARRQAVSAARRRAHGVPIRRRGLVGVVFQWQRRQWFGQYPHCARPSTCSSRPRRGGASVFLLRERSSACTIDGLESFRSIGQSALELGRFPSAGTLG